MSWITLAESDVITKLSGPEIAAMKTAALQAAQANPLPEVIAQVVKEIRGYVAACAQNQLGDGETIPDELLGAAISRVRYELATRLPVASLLTEDRRTANADALTRLRDVAACRFAIEQPATPSDQVITGPAVEVVTKTKRQATRAKLSGL
jgi:hypothetical protein